MRQRRTAIGCVAWLLLAGFHAAPLTAQQVCTLDECIDKALQYNIRMKNATNDLAGAEQQRKAAFTRYFPSVSASGGGFLADKHLLRLDVAPGMSMSMMKDGLAGGVSASLPLFTGGQIVNANRLAELNVEKYRLLKEQSENEVRLTTEQYFWQVVLLKEKLKTIGDVERQLAQIAKEVNDAVSAGVTNRNDLLQVQLRQNEMQSNRLTAENALALARRLLAQYMGAETDSVDVTFSPADSLPPSPESLYRQPESSLQAIPEYHLLQADFKANQLQYKMTVGKNMPTVAIGGGYMHDNLTDRDAPFWMGFATVSIPLTAWWEGSHNIRQQKLAVNNSENQLKDQSELLVIRMQDNWNKLNEAYRQIGIARRSIEQSAENLRLNTDYYTAGTCSMSDLLEAQSLYRQSRDKYMEARAQYAIKKREYLQSTGR